MWHAWERRENVQSFVGKPEREHSEDRGVDRRTELDWILGRLNGGM
jgi:hypothetical protein